MPNRRRRRSKALQWTAAILVGLLAYAIVAQWRHDGADQDFSGVRGPELAELLRSLDATNERLGRQIEELTATRDELRDANKSSQQAAEAAKQRADLLGILAGTVPVSGPGITIEISGPEGVMSASLLLDTVQELRSAGAEVMAINRQVRVVAQSWFIDEENGIMVDGRLITEPYTIEAIGDPATLAEAMAIRGGIIDTVEGLKGSAVVTEHDDLEITVLADAPELENVESAP